jgi:hypothetical protein
MEEYYYIDLIEIRCDGMGSTSSRQGPVTGSCEHGTEPLRSIKCWEHNHKIGSYLRFI